MHMMYKPETARNKTVGVVDWKTNDWLIDWLDRVLRRIGNISAMLRSLPCTDVTSVNFVTPPFQNRRYRHLIWLIKCYLCWPWNIMITKVVFTLFAYCIEMGSGDHHVAKIASEWYYMYIKIKYFKWMYNCKFHICWANR